MTRRRRMLVAVLSGAAGLVMAGPAQAAIGAGIGATPIALAQSVRAGHTYELPAAFVENTGSQPARYVLRIERLSHGSGRPVPSGWVAPVRNDFVLRPHRSTTVPLELTLPRGAGSGGYLTDVVLAAHPLAHVRGAAFGAAVATKLTFQVAGAPFHLPAGATDALIGLAAAGLALLALRRFPLRIHVEHT